VSRRGWFWNGRQGADISGPAKGRRRRNVGMSKVVRGDGEEAHRATARAPTWNDSASKRCSYMAVVRERVVSYSHSACMHAEILGRLIRLLN
jgi:hypothetical protein